MAKLIEKAEQNMKGITTRTTSQSKKKDWEIVRATATVLKIAYATKWDHQAFETMANRMEERVDAYFETKGEAGEILQIDEKLCSKVTEALKFEKKLKEMAGAGAATTLTLSDETAFTQIVAD